MHYTFKEEDKVKIIERFGNDYCRNVEGLIEPLTQKWQVDALELISSFSSNLVFKGHSTVHGSVVIKFGRQDHEFIGEVNALNYFDGAGTCKLIDVDLANCVLLEESICPGDELVLEKSLESRLEIFCDLFQQLHGNGKSVGTSNEQSLGSGYKSYEQWLFRIADYMEHQEAWQEVTAHIKNAKALFIDLSAQYPEMSLLHGDFHYYNILKGERDYKIIDPKGVLGHPIFDTPRYILNEFWDEADKKNVDETIRRVFDVFNKRLNIPKNVLSKLLYIEGAMAISWCVEDGASTDEKAQFLQTLDKLYGYIENL